MHNRCGLLETPWTGAGAQRSARRHAINPMGGERSGSDRAIMGAWMHARHGGSCAHVEPGETATKPVGAPHTVRGGLRTCTGAEDWARVWGTERPIRAWSLGKKKRVKIRRAVSARSEKMRKESSKREKRTRRQRLAWVGDGGQCGPKGAHRRDAGRQFVCVAGGAKTPRIWGVRKAML